jgi:hypothetical protein
MKSLFDKLRVHHTRNDIYDCGGNLPLPYRFTIMDTLSMRRGLNLRRAAPKPILPLTYTPPTNNPNSYVNKDELLNRFPSNRLPESVLPVNSFPLTELQQSLTSPPLPVKSRTDEMMALYFRIFPEHTLFQKYEFTISKEANKMLMYVFTSLGLSKMVRFSVSDLFLNTRIRGGLHHLLEGIASTSTSTPFQKVMEFLTYYKGMYGRLIIFVSLGVGCTVWYTFLPGVPEVAPPGILVPRELPYDSFKNVDFHFTPFKKMSYVEYKYITDQVLSAFENVYPFSEINLPSINSDGSNPDGINPDGSNARVALGLGFIVAVFLAMGMMSYSSPAELELITTSQAQELITTR